ncbi:MAG: conjugative transposon protein TraK [Prevotellaceae bacterium]|jgi:conjugative transposon TraK protein|nr:conjugative transposon protein TraK [Prevotellaceae bacterium]
MFKSLQNIETSFQLVRMVAVIAIVGSVVFSCYTKCSSDRIVAAMQRHVYVLDNGKSLMLALSQEDMMQNRPAEARHHVQIFHELFFTLSPDNEVINYGIRRSFNLSDKSTFDYFNDLKEAGYYRRLIANNIQQRVQVDSISCNMDVYPYQVKVFAQQIITRGSNITRRTLLTNCLLQNALRSDNNPHGFLITDFKVIENKDLSREKR